MELFDFLDELKDIVIDKIADCLDNLSYTLDDIAEKFDELTDF